MKYGIEEELLDMLTNPNDNVPTTEDNYFKITKELIVKLESVIDKIDSIPEEELKGMSDKDKFELSTYINNAERILRQGKIEE